MGHSDFALSALIADWNLSPELRAALAAPELQAFGAGFEAREQAQRERLARQAEKDAANRVAQSPWLAIFDEMADRPLSPEEAAEADEYLRREMEEDDRRHGL